MPVDLEGDVPDWMARGTERAIAGTINDLGVYRVVPALQVERERREAKDTLELAERLRVSKAVYPKLSLDRGRPRLEIDAMELTFAFPGGRVLGIAERKLAIPGTPFEEVGDTLGEVQAAAIRKIVNALGGEVDPGRLDLALHGRVQQNAVARFNSTMPGLVV
jgi:hypothetical protein